MGTEKKKRRSGPFWAVLFMAIAWAGGHAALYHPQSPLPDAWNPLEPLEVADPVNFITYWKLRHALQDDALCLSVLESSGAQFTRLPDFEENEQCHIRPRIGLQAVGNTQMKEVETRCQTALRMAMWEQHGIQPLAHEHLGQAVARIDHFSSYNCRKIRTQQGAGGRMSSHAQANAIDISGLRMEDETQIVLERDWDTETDQATFLKEIFQSACRWFPVALGPDFNALHKNHFHLQTAGWGYCR